MLRDVNIAIRFTLEVAALVALGYWGWVFQADSRAARIALGLGVPLIVAITWATFGSPRAPYRFPEAGRLALETAIFGAAIWALADAGRPGWAIGLALAALINTALMIAWRQ